MITFGNPESIQLWALLAGLLLFLTLLIRVRRPVSKHRFLWTEFILRLLAVILLLITIADPKFTRQKTEAHFLAALDISESLDSEVRQSLLDTLKSQLPSAAQLELLPFAGEVAPIPITADSSAREIQSAWSKLDRGKSNIELLIRNLSQFDTKNILFISDGQENSGSVKRALPALLPPGIHLFPFVPETGTEGNARLRIVTLHAPLLAPLEKSVPISIAVQNTTAAPQRGTLSVRHGEREIYKQAVTIESNGEKRITVPSDPSKGGIHEIVATFTPDQRDFAPSSESIFISGKERAKILLLSGDASDKRLLEPLLKQQAFQIDAQIAAANSLPTDLQPYRTIILNNAHRKQVSATFLRNLESFARAGGSVLIVGGNRSFGLGDYINTPLETISPVQFVPPQTTVKRLNVAVALVLDKSRSMAMDSKIDYAKDAARSVVKNLKDDDYVQIIGFDSAPFVVVRMAALQEIRATALERIGRLFPAGRTNLLPAIDEARRSLQTVPAGRKHAIILTDGRLPDGGPLYFELIQQMHSRGITVSTVMLGGDTDTSDLKQMAAVGGGAFYQTTDPSSLANIFLKDLKVAVGERTLKESSDFMVRPGTGILQSTSIRRFPPIQGYVQTKAKPNANLELITYNEERAEPLLASWDLDRGRVIAFTSDAAARWTARWANADLYEQFWDEIVTNLSNKGTQKTQAEDIRFDLRQWLEGGNLVLDLTIFDETQGALSSTIKTPKEKVETVAFVAQAPGHYQALIPNPAPGRYDFNAKIGTTQLQPVAFKLSGESFGERSGQGFNIPLLQQLALQTGGTLNPDLKTLEALVKSEVTSVSLQSACLMLLLACLLFEVFVRERRR
jgi:uncharacterized membrane protein